MERGNAPAAETPVPADEPAKPKPPAVPGSKADDVPK
jgi:hypothetical protein